VSLCDRRRQRGVRRRPRAFGYTPLADGDAFALGGVAFTVAALATPGHTEGSTLSLVGDGAALTGDTRFVDGVGRPDLADDAEAFVRRLHRSLHEPVLALPDAAMALRPTTATTPWCALEVGPNRCRVSAA